VRHSLRQLCDHDPDLAKFVELGLRAPEKYLPGLAALLAPEEKRLVLEIFKLSPAPPAPAFLPSEEKQGAGWQETKTGELFQCGIH
jgi:hypothetical protein